MKKDRPRGLKPYVRFRVRYAALKGPLFHGRARFIVIFSILFFSILFFSIVFFSSAFFFNSAV